MRISKETAWFVTSVGVQVWDTQCSKFHVLSFPESLLWELIARKIPSSHWIPLLTAVLSVQRDGDNGMPEWVVDALLSWSELGWLDGEI